MITHRDLSSLNNFGPVVSLDAHFPIKINSYCQWRFVARRLEAGGVMTLLICSKHKSTRFHMFPFVIRVPTGRNNLLSPSHSPIKENFNHTYVAPKRRLRFDKKHMNIGSSPEQRSCACPAKETPG